MKLSVILPNYNHGPFLPEALSAFSVQTRAADEVIIIDDASTDNSATIIEEFVSANPNMRLIRNPVNRGCIWNLNFGLELAVGDAIYFGAADDVTYPTLFEIGLGLLEKYPNAGLFSSRIDITDACSRNLGVFEMQVPHNARGYIDRDAAAHALMRDEAWFHGVTTIYRRQALIRVGGFRTELRSFTDGYVSRLLALKYGACFSPEVLGAWRRLEGGLAWSQSMELDELASFTELVEMEMKRMGNLFPPKYPERWKRRYIFGVRRFALEKARENQMPKSRLLRGVVRLREVLTVMWLFMILRPWDIAIVIRRRFRYRIGNWRVPRSASLIQSGKGG